MKKIFLLLVFLGVSAYADTSYQLLVNTAQEVGIYTALLESIHFFFYGSTAENYMSLLRTVVLFGAIVTMTKVAQGMASNVSGHSGSGANIMSIAAYYGFVVFMLLTLFGKESSIVVRHPESGTIDVSPKIPDIFAYTISFFSKLNYSMTKIAEESFTSLRGNGSQNVYESNTSSLNPAYGMTGLGYGGLGTELADLTKKTQLSEMALPDGSTIAAEASKYMSDCVITPLSANNEEDVSKILNSNSFFSKIDPTVIQTDYGINTATLLMRFGPSGYETCSDGYNHMKTFVTDLKNHYPRNLQKMTAALYYTTLLQEGSITGGSFSTTASTSTLAGSAAISQDTMINAAMNLSALNAYKDLGAQGYVAASGESAALTDLQQNGSSTGIFMARYLPIFSSFVFMIMIAAFPFMFAFALMPGGFSIIVQFVKTLAWISLWSPMAAVLNFFIDYRMVERMSANSNGVLLSNPSMSKLVDISSEAALMAGLAGYLYMMVPALSWMLVTGSGVMLSNITSSLGGAFQKHGNSEAVTQAAEQKGAADQADTSVAEMNYYKSGAVMAKESSSFMAQDKVYGNNFDQMSRDESKAQTIGMAKQRGAGSMMTMDGASGGGAHFGKMEGAATQSTAMQSSSLTRAQYKESGSVTAAQGVGMVEGSKKVLFEHGGTTGLQNDTANNARNSAITQHASASAIQKSVDDGSLGDYRNQIQAEAEAGIGGKGRARAKALSTKKDDGSHVTAEDIQQGLQNQQNKQIGEIASSGTNQSSEDSMQSGYQAGRQKAILENSTAKAIKTESNERLKNTANVDSGAKITAINRAANDSGVNVGQQIKDVSDESVSKVKIRRNTIHQENKNGGYFNTEVGKAKRKASMDGQDYSQYSAFKDKKLTAQATLESDVHGETAKRKAAEKVQHTQGLRNELKKNLNKLDDIRTDGGSEDELDNVIKNYNATAKELGEPPISKKSIEGFHSRLDKNSSELKELNTSSTMLKKQLDVIAKSDMSDEKKEELSKPYKRALKQATKLTNNLETVQKSSVMSAANSLKGAVSHTMKRTDDFDEKNINNSGGATTYNKYSKAFGESHVNMTNGNSKVGINQAFSSEVENQTSYNAVENYKKNNMSEEKVGVDNAAMKTSEAIALDNTSNRTGMSASEITNLSSSSKISGKTSAEINSRITLKRAEKAGVFNRFDKQTQQKLIHQGVLNKDLSVNEKMPAVETMAILAGSDTANAGLFAADNTGADIVYHGQWNDITTGTVGMDIKGRFNASNGVIVQAAEKGLNNKQRFMINNTGNNIKTGVETVANVFTGRSVMGVASKTLNGGKTFEKMRFPRSTTPKDFGEL